MGALEPLKITRETFPADLLTPKWHRIASQKHLRAACFLMIMIKLILARMSRIRSSMQKEHMIAVLRKILDLISSVKTTASSVILLMTTMMTAYYLRGTSLYRTRTRKWWIQWNLRMGWTFMRSISEYPGGSSQSLGPKKGMMCKISRATTTNRPNTTCWPSSRSIYSFSCPNLPTYTSW